MPPALGVWSPNHWATREVPGIGVCKKLPDSCAVRAEKCSTRAQADLTSPFPQPSTSALKGTMAVSITASASLAPISVGAKLALYSSRNRRAAGMSQPPSWYPMLRSLMTPVRTNVCLSLSLPSHQPLTTAASGTTAASMTVLALLVGHSAAAERAMTCCPTGGAVRVRRGLLHLCRAARDLSWWSLP